MDAGFDSGKPQPNIDAVKSTADPLRRTETQPLSTS